MVIGSQFDPANPGKSWYVGLIALNKPVTLERVAERYQSPIETIGDEKVVFTPQLGFAVLLEPDLLATVGSSDRQSLPRWVKAARAAQKPAIDRYLPYSASRHPHAPIFLAVHTDELLDPQGLHVALVRSKLFVGQDKLRDQMEKYLARLHGIRFVAQLGDNTIKATVYFDSGVAAMPELEALKPFVIEVLDRDGAALEDLQTAKFAFAENTVTLEFNITDTELGRIMALMSSPLVSPNPDKVESLALSPAGVSVDLTRRYYQQVNSLLDDLKKQTKRANDYRRTALWHETAAKRIEQMSILHLDKDVVAYGRDAALRMRAIANSLRGVPIQVATLENQKQLYVYGLPPWGGWGWPAINTNIPQVEAKQVAVIQQDAANRQKLWDLLDQERRQAPQ